MSMCIAPPGRASTSQRGLVKPWGPHHCCMSFASVQAWNTSSRGASKMRVMIRSWYWAAAAAALPFFSSTFFLLGLQNFEQIVEAVETLLPELAVLLDPVGEFAEGLGVEFARAPLRFPSASDQAGVFEDL